MNNNKIDDLQDKIAVRLNTHFDDYKMPSPYGDVKVSKAVAGEIISEDVLPFIDSIVERVIGKDEIEGHSGWLRRDCFVINEIKDRQRQTYQRIKEGL